jgi:hypothetical protein
MFTSKKPKSKEKVSEFAMVCFRIKGEWRREGCQDFRISKKSREEIKGCESRTPSIDKEGKKHKKRKV